MKPFFIFLLLLVLVACTPIGKVTEGLQTARATGPADPPGGYASPGTKLALSPTSLSFATTDATKTITVTATDRFVHKDIFLCKTPCASTSDWTKIGEFDGTLVIGTYLAGAAGISKQLALSRDDLMDGNNFIVIFTCGGIGLCNGNKWLLQKFTVFFAECGTDADCSSGKKCIGEKCISLCSSDSECALKSDPCGCFNTKDPLPPATGIVCSQLAETQCVCDRTCKTYGPLECAGKADGTKCGDVRVCKNQECVYDKCADVICIATKRCNPEDGACIDCLTDVNCPTGQKCKSATKTCVSCLADTDCLAGQKCVNDACVLVCTPPPEDMVSWLAGDDTAKDFIRGTTALVQGATYDVGKVGKAFKFDGVDDEVVVLHRETLSFAQNAPMSIDAWIYRTGTGSIGHILGKRTACGSMNYQLAYDSQSGLHLGSSASVAASNIQPPLNTWTHIAGTFDGSLMKIYINGELKGTATGATLGAPNTDGVKIGASGTCSNRWKGLIDEVEVYNRALSAAEIKAIFDASTAGKCKLSTLPPACSPACIAPKKCDEILGSCVDCLSNADCSGKFCDPATKTCVSCIDDASCLSPPNTVEDSLEVDASRSQDIYPIKTYTFDGKSYSIQAITDADQATLPLVFKVNGKQMPGLQIGQSAFIDGLTLGLRSFSLITDSNQAAIIGYRAAYFLTTKTTCDQTTKTCIKVSECYEKADGTQCSTGVCQSGSCVTVITTTQQIGTSATILSAPTLTSSSPASIGVDTVSGFYVGDDVLIHQTMHGTESSAGNYELNTITGIAGNTITLKNLLKRVYAITGNNRAQVVKVQKYDGLLIKSTGTLTAPSWDGNKGGIFALHVNGPITIEAGGKIDMSGKGFRGCTMTWKNDFCQYWVTGRTGESYAGGHNTAIAAGNPNVGGGGGGLDSYDGAGGGGGGAHLTAGTAGTGDAGWGYGCPAETADYSKGKGGLAYASYDLSTRLLFGSGGGCGDRSTGANGGGTLFILASSVAGGLGSLKAEGENGRDGVTGAGAGGSIYLDTTVPVDLTLLSVTGGTGGTQSWKNVKGGNGGTGATKRVSRLRT